MKLRKYLLFSLASCSFALASSPTPIAAQTEDTRPNIILMVSDDYGWPYYGFMIDRLRATLTGRNTATCDPASWTTAQCQDDFDPGEPSSTQYRCDGPPGAACQLDVATPNLDALAAGGIAFEHGYVTDSACTPAYQSLLSGLNRRDLASISQIGCQYGGPQTIPDALDALGYNTFLQGKSWLQNPTTFFNDYVCDTGRTSCMTQDLAIQSAQEDGIGESLPLEILKKFIKRQDARAVSTEEGRRPWFVMWSPLTPHYSYNNHPNRIDGMYGSVETTNPPHITANNFGHTSFRDYLEAITYYDERIGELMQFLTDLESTSCDPDPAHDHSEALDAAAAQQSYSPPNCAVDGQGSPLPGNPDGRYDGFRSNTLVIYVTDNPAGTQLSKGHFTENGLRTPIILNYPGHIEATGVHPARVGSIDVFPTILDYANDVSGPGRVFPDAESVRGIAEDPSTYPSQWRRYFFSNADAGSTGKMAVLDQETAYYSDGGTPAEGVFKVYTDGNVADTYTSLKGVSNVTVDPFESLWPAKPSTFVANNSTGMCLVKYADDTSTIQHLRGVLRSWDNCSAACRDWLVDEHLGVEACGGSPASPPTGCSASTTLCKDPAPDTTTFPTIDCS